MLVPISLLSSGLVFCSTTKMSVNLSLRSSLIPICVSRVWPLSKTFPIGFMPAMIVVSVWNRLCFPAFLTSRLSLVRQSVSFPRSSALILSSSSIPAKPLLHKGSSPALMMVSCKISSLSTAAVSQIADALLPLAKWCMGLYCMA